MTKDCQIISVDPEGVGPATSIISFFDPDSIGQAIRESDWDIQEMMDTLTQIARDADNYSARERMAAMKFIDDKNKEALSLAGIIRRFSAEATRDADGVKQTVSEEGLKLIRDGSARTLSTLELLAAGSQTPEVIDVDPVEETDDPGTGSDVQPESHPHSNRESSGDDPTSSGGGAGSGRSRTGRSPELCVHGTERPSETGAETPGSNHDQNPTGGAEDERAGRLPLEPGRSQPREELGGVGGPDEPVHQPASRDDDPARGEPAAALRTGDSTRDTCPARSTPYTPGESRRRAGLSSQSVPGPQPYTGPDLSDGRPADGAKDRRPRITTRTLDPADAESWSGFGGSGGSDDDRGGG